MLLNLNLTAAAQTKEVVGESPWGAEDEIGTLNRMTDATRLQVLSQIKSGKTYDLSVKYFVGMPSFHSLGDPGYQYWLTHTPHGTIVDNPNGLGMFIEQMFLEELSSDNVYEFAFISASLKLRGASGSPMRPIAIPINTE